MKNLNLIDTNTLERYLTYRELIDEDIEFIMSITSVLSQYRDCAPGNEGLQDLNALGYINALLNSRVQNIMENLEKLLPLEDVQIAMAEREEV